MFNFAGVGDSFEPRIFYEQIRRKVVMQRNVNIFVNCGGDKESAEILVVRRQIRAATAKSDAKWGARDNHFKLGLVFGFLELGFGVWAARSQS